MLERSPTLATPIRGFAVRTLAAALAVAAPPLADACPAYVQGKDVLLLGSAPRSSLALFALASGGKSWQALPLQVDPLDENGVLRSPASGAPDLATKPFEANDRLALRREGFGARAVAGAPPLPCRARRVVELRTPGDRPTYAYLAACDGPPSPALAPPLPVRHDAAQRRITAERYDYVYLPNNQLMYKTMTTRDPAGASAPMLASTDAELDLHLDIVNFFTLDLGNDDVESYVSASRIGNVGMLANMDFYLRLLFFKIDLKMATTVGFWGDSAHIPSLVDVPRDGPSMLHPDSGLLYAFKAHAARFDQSRPERTMPNADAKVLLAGPDTAARVGAAYCGATMCTFRLRGTIGPQAFGIDVDIAPELVKMGFFPMWVPDVAAFKKAMGWTDEVDAADVGRVALYINNSGMKQGQYKFDQWLRVGPPESMVESCPQPVTVGELAAFSGGK
jgi:hypothetical protein